MNSRWAFITVEIDMPRECLWIRGVFLVEDILPCIPGIGGSYLQYRDVILLTELK